MIEHNELNSYQLLSVILYSVIPCVYCVHTHRDLQRVIACDKLSFRKMNGNRRKCLHRTRATNAYARCF